VKKGSLNVLRKERRRRRRRGVRGGRLLG